MMVLIQYPEKRTRQALERAATNPAFDDGLRAIAVQAMASQPLSEPGERARQNDLLKKLAAGPIPPGKPGRLNDVARRYLALEESVTRDIQSIEAGTWNYDGTDYQAAIRNARALPLREREDVFRHVLPLAAGGRVAALRLLGYYDDPRVLRVLEDAAANTTLADDARQAAIESLSAQTLQDPAARAKERPLLAKIVAEPGAAGRPSRTKLSAIRISADFAPDSDASKHYPALNIDRRPEDLSPDQKEKLIRDLIPLMNAGNEAAIRASHQYGDARLLEPKRKTILNRNLSDSVRMTTVFDLAHQLETAHDAAALQRERPLFEKTALELDTLRLPSPVNFTAARILKDTYKDPSFAARLNTMADERFASASYPDLVLIMTTRQDSMTTETAQNKLMAGGGAAVTALVDGLKGERDYDRKTKIVTTLRSLKQAHPEVLARAADVANLAAIIRVEKKADFRGFILCALAEVGGPYAHDELARFAKDEPSTLVGTMSREYLELAQKKQSNDPAAR